MGSSILDVAAWASGLLAPKQDKAVEFAKEILAGPVGSVTNADMQLANLCRCVVAANEQNATLRATVQRYEVAITAVNNWREHARLGVDVQDSIELDKMLRAVDATKETR